MSALARRASRKFTTVRLAIHFVLCVALLGSSHASNSHASHSKRDRASTSGQLVFVANVADNWDIFVARADGSSCFQLSETRYDENFPSLSPDRTKVAYGATDGKLRIVDVRTRGVVVIPQLEQTRSEIQPAFSPDGERIAFVAFESGMTDDSDLAMFDTRSWKSKIFHKQRSAQFFPNWSPEGNQIVYVNVHCSSECGRIIDELWTAQTHRTLARQILMTNSQCMQPDWSPDGEKIVFASDMAGNFDVWVYDLKSQGLKRLTEDPAPDTDPCWSPDGQRIAFTSTRSGMTEIFVMDKNGKNVEAFRPFGERRIECRNPNWK